jgi:multiple antibiotic resistance protein
MGNLLRSRSTLALRPSPKLFIKRVGKVLDVQHGHIITLKLLHYGSSIVLRVYVSTVSFRLGWYGFDLPAVPRRPRAVTVPHTAVQLLCCNAVSEFAKFLGFAFSALLPLVNPLGSALMLLGLIGDAPLAVYRALARKIAIATTIFLLMIEAVGTALLKFFGISLPVVQVSGGLVLAAMGWNLLNEKELDEKGKPPDVDVRILEQQIFYPLTFPITAGPGCIVVMVTLSAHASLKGLLPSLGAHAGIATAVVLMCVLVFICYARAPKITARISPQTVHGIIRLIAFVLLCIGVQITLNGVQAIVKSMRI